MKQFTKELTSEKPRETVVAEALQSFTIPLARHGYELDQQSEAGLTYMRKYHRWYTVVAAILFFPIGLLALLIVERAYITITVTQADGQTVVRVDGEGTRKVADAFESLTL